MQTKRATEDANGADESLRHNKRRRSESQKTQTEQMTHQGTANADGADEV